MVNPMKSNNEDDELEYPDWLTDEWLAELEAMGFDWDISWDSLGRITLHIWKMTAKDRKEWEEWARLNDSMKKITKRL
jgi:hypothetical protein